MYLIDFNIKNFRSIVDSGWNTISPDNITALIGQNESGKTSVLEALYSFYEGSVSEDMLRSDMSLPEVSCSFKLEENETPDFLDERRMPENIMPAIIESGKVTLTRKWFPDLSSQVILAGDQVTSAFDQFDQRDNSIRQATIEKAKAIMREYDEIDGYIAEKEQSIPELKKDIETSGKKLGELQKMLKRQRGKSKQDQILREIETTKNEIDKYSALYMISENELTEKRKIVAGRKIIKGFGKKLLELLDKIENAGPEAEKAYKELNDVEYNLSHLISEKERKAAEVKLFGAKEKYIKSRRATEVLNKDLIIIIKIINKLFEDKDPAKAEKEAIEEYSAQNKLYTPQQAGELFFSRIPRFEFFEDFSSLLPNRIDLDDIFEDNTRVEGFKAVRNFLIIAGLDPDFFRQSNNRILKQKIENLNNEVTIDFQEYWRQNIGKTNKIRINFELEHYDLSNPDKKGRPYLEFWIKDQHERLYPKQRSRGVRWFLSFYLELKAFARENENSKRILLIDEPGLSLHARAQEDVIKVFEDIKEKIQIIYTTHSPHLIDHDKLYRLLAVQRADHNSEQSETVIFDTSRLHSASSDTLSPVCSILGAGFSRQHFSMQNKNIIVEDICSYYYLAALHKLTGMGTGTFFLPAEGPAGVATLVNLLTGWGFDFSLLLFDNEDNQLVINNVKSYLSGFDPEAEGERLHLRKGIGAPEDIFSTLDFKKHIIRKRIGISESNSAYLKRNGISRPLLAAAFTQEVNGGKLTIADFDDESRQNIETVFAGI